MQLMRLYEYTTTRYPELITTGKGAIGWSSRVGRLLGGLNLVFYLQFQLLLTLLILGG